MGQTKILPKSEVMRITGVSGKQYKTVQWHGAQLVIKQFIDLNDFVETVHVILNECTDQNGALSKDLIDFATRLHVITAYSFVELPDDLEKIYYIVYASDLYETIVKSANTAQINAIIDTVNSYIGR